MNIAIFTNNYKPFIGGVPISIERLTDSLRECGHNVWIFAPEYPDYIEEGGVIRVPLLRYQKTKNFDFPIANIFSNKLREKFKSLEVDVIHVHHPFWMGKLGVQLGERYGIPVVFTYHTRYEKYIHNIPLNSLVSDELIHSKVRRFMKRCDRVIAPSRSIEEYLRRLDRYSSIEVVPTGISNGTISSEWKRVEEIKAKYTRNGERLLCSVSRLTKEKNIGTLIRNLKELKDRTNGEFKCLIIGEGPERQELERLIGELKLENEVILVGNIPQDEIGNYYKAADLFVFNSLSETQGLVVGEAMINNTLVIALDATGVRDVVVDGRNGYLAMDSDEFVDRCREVLEDEELLARLGRGAIATAKGLTSRSIAEKMASVYMNAVEEKRYYERKIIFG